MHEVLLENLPPEPSSVLDEIQVRVSASHRKIVVLDDDPTGTQSVYGVPVLTEWSIPVLQAELKLESPAFFILTNSRSLPKRAAQALNRQVGFNLKIVFPGNVGDENALVDVVSMFPPRRENSLWSRKN